MRTTPKSDGRGTGRSDPPVVGDQVVPQGLVEVHAEAGNTIPTQKVQAGILGSGKNVFTTNSFLPNETDGSAILLRSGSRGSNAAAFRGKRHNYVCRSICWLGVDQRGDKAYATDQKIRSEGEPLFTGE